jgi:hypothetical protein
MEGTLRNQRRQISHSLKMGADIVRNFTLRHAMVGGQLQAKITLSVTARRIKVSWTPHM